MTETAQTLKLADFLEQYQDEIVKSVVANYPPLYDFGNRKRFIDDLKQLKRKPFLAQLDGINALAKLYESENSGILVGEMGTGKTICSIVLAYVLGLKRVLVMCPPHLIKKWEREIRITLPTGSVDCYHLKRFTDIDQAVAATDNGAFNFYIVGRERAKLSYQWKPAFRIRKQKLQKGVWTDLCVCPDCGKVVTELDGTPLTPADFKKRKIFCRLCSAPLWQAYREGPRRFAIAEWIKRKHKGFFDLLIVDECHEYKARGSAQGYAAGILASCCQKSLALTGTLFGGYSSTLFHLLYRLSQGFKSDYGHGEVSKWIDHFGIWERVTKYEDDPAADNTSSRGKKYRMAPREKPGINPVILPKYLLDKTVFIRLSDIAIDLPSLSEEIIDVEMAEEQAIAYHSLFNQLRSALVQELRKGSRSLLAIYLQALLTYPDRSMEGEQVYNKLGDLVAEAPALSRDTIYPKEKQLLDLVKAEKAAGRRVLVFCTHTKRRDTTQRLLSIFTSNGLSTEILKQNVASEKREAWIQEHANSLDCLITNPKLVQTGLDLVQFPTIIFFEVEYSVYVLRQASRRSWRIGQDQPVKIYYMIYENTMQEQALKLVALKMKTSLAIEGDLSEDGLGSYSIADDNLYVELARNIAKGSEISQSLDSIWHGMQVEEQKNAQADFLVESLEALEDIPELNGVLKTPIAKIRERFNPELWENLLRIRRDAKPQRKQKPRDPNQMTLF